MSALWRPPEPLVLASASAVRRKLLQAAGLPVAVHPAAIDERALERAAGGTPLAIARHLAEAKAATVAARLPGRLVVAADQTLGFAGRTFAKPADRAAARAQLQTLRGHTHELHSAVSLWMDTQTLVSYADTAQLTMRTFSDAFLDAYLDLSGAAATASVGGYQLEGIGIHLFEKVDGDYFTILGLPLLPLLAWLRAAGHLAA